MYNITVDMLGEDGGGCCGVHELEAQQNKILIDSPLKSDQFHTAFVISDERSSSSSDHAISML